MIDHARFEAILHEAGRVAMASWPGHAAGEAEAAPLEIWEKAPGDPVSSADLAVNALLKAELARLLPAAGWLSEETVDDPAARERDLLWLVDPIDGTRDYIRGRAGWAVSVALIHARRPLMAALCAPARGEMWFAQAGRGATRNGAPLAASRRRELAGARVPARVLAPEDADLVSVDQPNSIALRIAMVAAGEADLVATLRWGYEWDIGAAALIAREAGAAVTDAFGRKLDYNKPDPRAFGLLASAPAIHEAAVARLAERARRLV